MRSSRYMTMKSMLVAAAVSVFSGPVAAQDIHLGAILPLTGPAAPTGLEEQQGVIFAIERVNAKGGVKGRKIVMHYEDSQGKPDVGVLSFNRLVDLHGAVATLTAYSSISIAIAPLGTRRELLIVNPAAQSNQLREASPYLVNTTPLVGDEVVAIGNYAYDKLGKTATIIYENGAAGIDGKDVFKETFVGRGGKILFEDPVEFGQTNYRSVLLKSAASKPDMVYISITQGHPALVEQLNQVPNFPIGIGNTFSRPFLGFKATAGWFQTSIQSGTPPEAVEFKKRFNTEDMPYFAREYYNSTNIILQCIEKVLDEGKAVTGKNLREALFAIKTFNSPVTNIVFDTNTAKRAVDIMRHAADGSKNTEKVDYTPPSN